MRLTGFLGFLDVSFGGSGDAARSMVKGRSTGFIRRPCGREAMPVEGRRPTTGSPSPCHGPRALVRRPPRTGVQEGRRRLAASLGTCLTNGW